MIDLLKEALVDSVLDTIKLFPFLFITYIVMEYLEHRTKDHSSRILVKAGAFGPLMGAVLGIVPQCGFSAAAASLYSGGVVSLGTMIAVFLSTSDEMLPIFISEAVPAAIIIRILLSKVVIAVISGIGVDICIRLTGYKDKTEKHIHDLCEQEGCGCHGKSTGIVNIMRSALIHTLHILVFIFVVSFLIALLMIGVGEETIATFMTGYTIPGILFAALIGLIPNCAASVALTQLYLNGLIGFEQLMAGLLVGAGVGLLVLFRTNKHIFNNIKIVILLYCLGAGWGILLYYLFRVFDIF